MSDAADSTSPAQSGQSPLESERKAIELLQRSGGELSGGFSKILQNLPLSERVEAAEKSLSSNERNAIAGIGDSTIALHIRRILRLRDAPLNGENAETLATEVNWLIHSGNQARDTLFSAVAGLRDQAQTGDAELQQRLLEARNQLLDLMAEVSPQGRDDAIKVAWKDIEASQSNQFDEALRSNSHAAILSLSSDSKSHWDATEQAVAHSHHASLRKLYIDRYALLHPESVDELRRKLIESGVNGI